MADEVLEIRMQSPGYGGGEPCCNCGKPSSGFHGLPIFNGDIVSNDWAGEFGGKPCCERCYDLHEHGQVPTFDHYYRHLLGGFINGEGI